MVPRHVVRQVPSFLRTHDSQVVEDTLCVRKGPSGRTDDPTSAYTFDANDPVTQKAIADAHSARGHARDLLVQSQSASSSSVKEALEAEAILVFTKTDKMLRETFGRMVFREQQDPNGTGPNTLGVLDLSTGVLHRLLTGPHVVRNEAYSYTKGGMFDIWNSGPKTRVSGGSNNSYELTPKLKLSSQESDQIFETVKKSLLFARRIPNPEHRRQLVLTAMMVDSWRRHCSSSSFRPLSRMGIQVSGVTRNYCQEAEDFVKEMASVPGSEELSTIAEDVRQELDIEMKHWRDGGFRKTFGPKTFGLH